MTPRLALITLALPLAGCLGNSSEGNEVVGQVKRVQHKTPIICPDYRHADVSMGVIRNGVGSVSTGDVWMYVPNDADWDKLRKAADGGQLVKVKYDVARLRFCVESETVIAVEVVP